MGAADVFSEYDEYMYDLIHDIREDAQRFADYTWGIKLRKDQLAAICEIVLAPPEKSYVVSLAVAQGKTEVYTTAMWLVGGSFMIITPLNRLSIELELRQLRAGTTVVYVSGAAEGGEVSAADQVHAALDAHGAAGGVCLILSPECVDDDVVAAVQSAGDRFSAVFVEEPDLAVEWAADQFRPACVMSVRSLLAAVPHAQCVFVSATTHPQDVRLLQAMYAPRGDGQWLQYQTDPVRPGVAYAVKDVSQQRPRARPAALDGLAEDFERAADALMSYAVGTKMIKEFNGEDFTGTVVSRDVTATPPTYQIKYADGDTEDLTEDELKQYVVDGGDGGSAAMTDLDASTQPTRSVRSFVGKCVIFTDTRRAAHVMTGRATECADATPFVLQCNEAFAATYTSKTCSSVQLFVLNSFNESAGSVKVLSGTSCLGFGVDLSDVQEVVITYLPSGGFAWVVQFGGRGGRGPVHRECKVTLEWSASLYCTAKFRNLRTQKKLMAEVKTMVDRVRLAFNFKAPTGDDGDGSNDASSGGGFFSASRSRRSRSRSWPRPTRTAAASPSRCCSSWRRSTSWPRATESSTISRGRRPTDRSADERWSASSWASPASPRSSACASVTSAWAASGASNWPRRTG